MPKQENRSQLDSNQIPNHVFDEQNDAIRAVIVAETEMAIAISKDDNDSVYSYKKKAFVEHSIGVSVQPGEASEAINVEDYSKVVIYHTRNNVGSGGEIDVEVSADGITFKKLVSNSLGFLIPVEIIAKQLRLVCSAAPTSGSVDIVIGLSS